MADDDFHRVLVEHSANERLIRTHAQTKAALLRYERYALGEEARIRRSADQHDQIIALLDAGDQRAAAAAIRRNFEDSRPDVERGLDP
jgi:DNA-binding GntR family transcriptional regulator